jgi:hypothetical protein
MFSILINPQSPYNRRPGRSMRFSLDSPAKNWCAVPRRRQELARSVSATSASRFWELRPKEISGSRTMSEQEFQAKLAELMGEISTLPPAEREKLEKLASETRQRHERLTATVNGLQESLDYLRLSIKYLVFDLEATRRENNYLRKMLEEGTSNENDA